MKILISTMTAFGHIAPFLTLAKHLIDNGNEIVWHSGVAQQKRIEQTGAIFTPFVHTPDIVDLAVAAQKYSGFQAANKAVEALFIDPMLGQVKDYQEITKKFKADLLLVDMCGLGAEAFHELGGPKYATVGINPLRLPDSPIYGTGKLYSRNPVVRWINQHVNNAMNHMVFKSANKSYNAARTKLGLEPINNLFFDYTSSKDLLLQGTTPSFEFDFVKIPAHAHFVGPMLAPVPIDFKQPIWWHRLDAGEPVLHVTQGTIETNASSLIKPTIEAVRNLDVLLVVTTPNPASLGTLPDNVIVEKFIPHAVLLPKTDIMITNAGYNGVKESLAVGVPLIVAGKSEDKAEVCARVTYSGAGIDLHTDKPSSNQIKNAIQEVLTHDSYKEQARKIENEFQHYNSNVMSTELLEKLLKS